MHQLIIITLAGERNGGEEERRRGGEEERRRGGEGERGRGGEEERRRGGEERCLPRGGVVGGRVGT